MRFGFREMMFVLLLLAMLVASYFFIFAPGNQQVADGRREIQQMQQKLQALEASTRNIADLGTEIDRLGEAISLFEEKLPAEREVEVILKKVWETAAKHQLTPRSVRTDKTTQTAQYTELPIKMVIVGNFDGFYSFLLDLERISRITRLPKMSLQKLEAAGEGQMQADLVLSIFFESQPGAAAPANKGRL